jgi:DNA mismatch repair protein MutS
MEEKKLTPMMKQYRKVKADTPPDSVLMFRLGDFYEMFFDDAKRAAPILDVTLTSRGGVPMCGIPYHAIDAYLPRLLDANVKVAIAEQMEDPKLAKGIVKREISKVITPGTVTEANALAPARNNFLAAIAGKTGRFGLALLDISTGDFRVAELESWNDLEIEFQKAAPQECLVPESLPGEMEWNGGTPPNIDEGTCWTPLDDWMFDHDTAMETLTRHFSVASMDGFGCAGMTAGISAAGAVLRYAAENLRRDAAHVKTLKTYDAGKHMVIDSATRRNLELVDPMPGGAKDSTLLGVLDDTSTPMGGRLIREWILRPLRGRDAVNARLDAVSAFKDDPLTLAEIRETLAPVRDMERIIARVNMGTANARDMLALANALSAVPGLQTLLDEFDMPFIVNAEKRLDGREHLAEEIERSIVENPPITISDGGIIREGVSSELDELRSAATEGKNWIAALQASEQEKTGIKNLKIKYNKVFGYHIEVSKANLHLVPEEYIRKQTIANGERFITPELKEVENKILGAEDKAKALELRIFQELRDKTMEETERIQRTANAIAEIDVAACLAERAAKLRYNRPRIVEHPVLEIKAGRHPVLDAAMTEERFVPNDVSLDADNDSLMIITGPNMAGKSTYIRQVALLTIMAHMGSFIPADSAEIGVVDRVFTRVGASDDISRGRSTFMVEMIEMAAILNNATPKSLVVLDEIGRGTSTFDGVSIAWAVAERLHDHEQSKARALFATHYHELTELAITRKGVKNYNVAVREYGDKIIFLRQILPGASDKSYGIHVAKLAGLPQPVVDRANEILENLESNAIAEAGMPALAKHRKKTKQKTPTPRASSAEPASTPPAGEKPKAQPPAIAMTTEKNKSPHSPEENIPATKPEPPHQPTQKDPENDARPPEEPIQPSLFDLL